MKSNIYNTKSNIYKELRARYSEPVRVWDVYLGTVLVAVIMIGGAYAYVKGQEVMRQWDNLEARACLIP